MPNTNLRFQLRRFCRNVPESQLLDDLRQVAHKLNRPTLNMADYRHHGRFSPVTFPKRFGSWNNALITAGLQPSRNFHVPIKQVLADIQRVARKLRTQRLSGTQYLTHGRYCLPVIYRHFENWQNAVDTAGLTPCFAYRISDEKLFENLERAWQRLGRQPVSTELFPPLSTYGIAPYQRRFGGYQNALQAFMEWQTNRPPQQVPQTSINESPETWQAALHKTSRIVNYKLRYLALARDHFRCQACGRSPASDPTVKLEIDHKTPWSRGGETILENLQTLCEICNAGKSNLV